MSLRELTVGAMLVATTPLTVAGRETTMLWLPMLILLAVAPLLMLLTPQGLNLITDVPSPLLQLRRTSFPDSGSK